MFHDIPRAVKGRMAELEAIDRQDRLDGTPRAGRLRQIPVETGRFIALLAACAPPGAHLEVGTSGGYSSLWLGLACREKNVPLVTFEISAEKARLAAETFRLAEMEAVIQVVQGDARQRLATYSQVAYCFLDAEKEIYQACYNLLIPNLVPGGLLVADNAVSHASELQPLLAAARADRRVDSLVVPIGKGLLVCRRRVSGGHETAMQPTSPG